MTETKKEVKVLFSTEARRALFKGLDVTARVVGATLGPKGRCVIIQTEDDAPPVVTKDGVTVSKSIRLKDPAARMGAQLIREAASQTNDVAGDGTTTATVLTHAMVKAGIKLLEAGHSPRELCNDLERTTDAVCNFLREFATPVASREDLVQVATVSANGDVEMGELIGDAMTRVGRDGVVTVEDAKGTTTSLEVVEGTRFDRGYLSPYFVTDSSKMVAAYDNAKVLLVDGKVSSLKDVVPLLEHCLRSSLALIIVADEVDGDAMQGLVVNRVNSRLKVVAVRTPGHGRTREENLTDLAKLTGATVLGPSTGTSLTACEPSKHLGTAKRIVVDAKSTTLVGDGSAADAVTKHVEELRTRAADPTIEPEEVAHLRQRAARLASGVAVIKVGGATELEMVERRHRLEDAINATRAAAEEGVVPGGGLALNFAGTTLSRTLTLTPGARIVLEACDEPVRKIVENAGGHPSVVLDALSRRREVDGRTMEPGEFGYDAASGRYVDAARSGIIDPVKVTRTALANAASVAVTFLSLDAAVTEDV